MIIDLHCHTKEHSSCSIISVHSLLDCYIANGKVDGVCITDHNCAWSTDEQKEIFAKYQDKIKIFFAMELRTSTLGDVLIFCKNQDDYSKLWKDMDFLQIGEVIDLSQCAIVWAHPLRYDDSNLRFINQAYLSKFDAIELYNGNVNQKIIDYTRFQFDKYGKMKYTGGSDTHSEKMACKYATKFDRNIANISDLVDAIKNGKYEPFILR